MKVDTSQKPCSIGIDFGGTSVKIGSLSEMLSDENQDPKVLKTSDYDSVQSLIAAMVNVVDECREDKIYGSSRGLLKNKWNTFTTIT